MTTSYTLTGDFNDLLGEEPRVTGAWLETNLPAGTALVDLDANKVLLSGPKRITLDASNTFSISLIATNSTGTNVTDGTLRYRVRAQYSDGTGVPRTWESGFFDLTAAADLSDKVGGAGDLDVTIAPSASLIDAPTAANVTGPSQTRTALDAAYAPGGTAGTAAAADTLALMPGTDYYSATRPIITFIDDDADPLFHDVWEPIIAEKGISLSVAAIAGRVAGVFSPVGYPSMTLSELKAIKAAGHDILSHGWEHLASYDAANTADELYTDWQTAKQWFIDNLPEAPEAQEVIVYPGGLAATEVAKKAQARKLYRYGVTVSAPIGASSGNREPVDTFGVYRFNLDTGTEVAAKAAIDSAVSLGTWLIFLTHAKELDAGGRAANMTKIRNVIDYAVAQGVPIMKFTDAEKVKGNAISIGEFTDQDNSTVVSRRGARRHWGSQGSWTPRLYGSVTAGVHTYTQQKGYYQVNGGMVTVRASISIAAADLDAAMSGNLRIDGLPAAFMPSALDVAAVAPCNYNIFNLGANYSTVWVKNGGTYLNLLRDGNNVAEAFLTNSQIVAGQTLNLVFVMTYMRSGDPAWV